jgi:hypothetical protein
MRIRRTAATLSVAALTALALSASWAAAGIGPLQPTVVKAVAFDKIGPLSGMTPITRAPDFAVSRNEDVADGPVGDERHASDGALQTGGSIASTPSPLFTFEGPSNEDNFTTFGFRVNPPDPNGDVGKRHVVFMVNLVFSIYTKTGQLLLGPVDTGTLWQGFAVKDCTDPSGDPIVVYDDKADRWILTQFTTRGPEFFNCVAVSQTPDPTGAYFRYAFSTGLNFPDYPKYGVWPNGGTDDDSKASLGDSDDDEHGGSLTITTREFDPADNESIGIYAVNRAQLLAGDPNTQVVSFNLAAPPNLVGDGLLPADHDGKQPPPEDAPQVILGTQDDDAGAAFDALNVFHLTVDWDNPAAAAFFLKTQLPTAPFDSIYPCAPTSRDCLEQPGITDPGQFLDILSYRQRPTWRLQYRNFGEHEALVTNQSVEARTEQAGVRWYELRDNENPFIFQQGTFAPNDGVHRWMGSVALDKKGNLAAGYSVVNGTNVFPGIRYASRLAGDPLGELSQGEAVLQNGSGVQTAFNSRWGDYTSMNVDPKDGCTFYYFNEYYRVSGTPQPPPPAPPTGDGRPWKTRVGAFKLPGCKS